MERLNRMLQQAGGMNGLSSSAPGSVSYLLCFDALSQSLLAMGKEMKLINDNLG